MIDGKTIAVVIPVYNEEKQLPGVLETIPGFVDRIIVVDDASTDRSFDIARSCMDRLDIASVPEPAVELKDNRYNRAEKISLERDREELQLFPEADEYTRSSLHRLVLIRMKKNHGVGAAIAKGYRWAKDHHMDCTAVMAGDGQMDPDELQSICQPVLNGEADYVKGNRLRHRSARYLIPPARFFGNSVLSAFTKLASGYWHVSDTQSGFTAISLAALKAIDLHRIYRRYGAPNDILVKLNIAYCTVREVGIKPVYGVGEKSKMHLARVIIPIKWLLIRSFFRRLWIKYLFRDLHPLFFLYHLGILLLLLSIPYAVKLLKLVFASQDANPLTALAFAFLFIMGFQSLLFAMWMDIQDNERLNK